MAAFFHGTRFINYQRPAHELLAVARLHRALHLTVIYFGETEPAGFIGEPVPHHTDVTCRYTLLLEPRRQIRFCSSIGKIANV